MKIDYEKEQFKEQKESNLWLAVNTIFTIITGLAILVFTYLQWKN